MSSEHYSEVVSVARDYYNSADADAFYSAVWGGEDIHIGIYEKPGEPILDASRRTVEKLAARVEISSNQRVLDIGSGYGGAARYLAATYGCRVAALNLSEVENERARRMNQEQGLSERIDVVDGSFEQLPFDHRSFDLVWSQDAILHSGNRPGVFAEVARTLKPGGSFVFTDPMQADDCPAGVLQPILDRIHLSSLGSPRSYRQMAEGVGLKEVRFEDLTPQLVTHYSRVLEEVESRTAQSIGVSADYLERMKKGLRHWIDGGKKGYLAWGILQFQRV